MLILNQLLPRALGGYPNICHYMAAESESKSQTLPPVLVLKYTANSRRVFRQQSDS